MILSTSYGLVWAWGSPAMLTRGRLSDHPAVSGGRIVRSFTWLVLKDLNCVAATGPESITNASYCRISAVAPSPGATAETFISENLDKKRLTFRT
jgi:hypothetical protein